jgi:hypothetical protein
MKLTMRATRRLAAGVALACAAVALPAAALAASGAPSRQGAAAAAVPGCTAASTEVWLGLPGDGTAGTTFYQLEFSNVGRHTCSLFGHPGVSAVNIHGHQVGLPASHSGIRHTVILRPGRTSHVVLAVGDAGAFCAHPVPAARLRVFPPGQTRSQLVPLAVHVCPHRVTMRVLPVRPGTGIPRFTTR